MIYGYARVSSTGQANYGTSLDSQEEELKRNGATVIYKDVFTGTSAHRPELDKLMGVLTSGDTLIVTKMDRLGRSAGDIINLLKGLVHNGVSVNILNMGTVNDTMMGRFMITILSGVAEFEHDMILERMNQGKAQKRATDPNWREGRLPDEFDMEAFLKNRTKVKKGIITVDEACSRMGISRSKWYRYMKKV